MGFFSRLFKHEEAQPARETEVSEAPCLHATLLPHWNSADDFGRSDRVASYTCQGCSRTFSYEEGQRLLAEEAERLRLANIERLGRQQ